MLWRSLLLVVVLVFSSHAWGEGQEMTLPELIEAVRQQGHSVVYSNSLVHSGQSVHVEQLDLPALQAALTRYGLQLVSQSGIWLVIRDEESPAAPQEVEGDVPATNTLETLIVTGSLHRFPGAATGSSSHTFSQADMSQIPALGSDAMRSTLRLPGISSVGVSAKPRIRGGLQDELLVVQDGVELLEPFHLADYHSPYSSIDYHTIESLDFYTGGFPSRYGNRMSGVMDIQNKWLEDEFNTDIGVSSFAQFARTQGRFGEEQPARWLLSVRQGDLSDLADYIETRSGKPEYVDASARLAVELSDALTMAVGLNWAEDDIVFRGEDELATSNIETGYFWAGLGARVRPNLEGRLTLSWLEFRRRKLLDSFEDEAKGGFLSHRQEIGRLALRNDWSTLQGANLYEFGWQVEYNRGDYDHQSQIDRGDLAEILDTQRMVERDIHVEPDGFSGGAYLQTELQLGADLTLQPSLRWDFQNYRLQGGAQDQFSPRLGIAWELSDSSRTRLSLGRFYQPEGIHELQVIDGVTQFFDPQYVDQALVGLEWQRGALELVGEVYYKRYQNQKGRFENVFNPFVLLPEMEPDRVGLFPEKAVARGVDLDASFGLGEFVKGTLRYSYMEAQDRLASGWVDRRWSQEHTVNAGISYQRGSFSLSLAATWHSGWRSSQLPDFVAQGEVVAVEDVLNNTDLRDYFSLDISARKYWDIGSTRVQIYADISNLTDRSNQAGIDFDIEETEEGFLILPDGELLLGRVPSVGITLSF